MAARKNPQSTPGPRARRRPKPGGVSVAVAVASLTADVAPSLVEVEAVLAGLDDGSQRSVVLDRVNRVWAARARASKRTAGPPVEAGLQQQLFMPPPASTRRTATTKATNKTNTSTSRRTGRTR